MRAFVRLRSPHGASYELVHGDLIGRLRTAALCLDEPQVSEAHAMISLREQELKLIALRGGFAVEGRPLNEVALKSGMEIVLARGLTLQVEEVQLPEWVLGIEGDGLAQQVLPPVSSLEVEPGRIQLMAGYREKAAAWLWNAGDFWRLQHRGQQPRAVGPGEPLLFDDASASLVAIGLASAGQAATRPHGGVEAPLHIQANFDTVRLVREGAVVAVLGGVAARIVSELVVLNGPAHWTVLVGLLWPEETDPEAVRSRLDVNLSRLRRKLREARIRTDLIHSDGAGQIELLLYPHDTVEDRT